MPIHITLPLNDVLPTQLKNFSDPGIKASTGIGAPHKQNSNKNNYNIAAKFASEFLC
jgi:hypothetical protein